MLCLNPQLQHLRLHRNEDLKHELDQPRFRENGPEVFDHIMTTRRQCLTAAENTEVKTELSRMNVEFPLDISGENSVFLLLQALRVIRLLLPHGSVTSDELAEYLYENVQADDGFCRSKLCRQGRVLRFVTDATDDEISAAAADGNKDRGVYWAHFGVGTAAYKSAIMAVGKFEADGIPTRTDRLGGDRWRYVEARVRTTDAEFGLVSSDGSTSHP